MEQERVTKTERETVAAYLAVIRAPKQRGRQRTLESAQRELATVTTRLDEELMTALDELALTQRRIDLEREVAERRLRDNGQQLEDEFVKVAAKYGQAKGISYAAWRAVGVSAAVLRAAGIR